MSKKDNPSVNNLTLDQACFLLSKKIDRQPFIIAIEGEIAAGKSTLAKALQSFLQKQNRQALVVSMDDYYFPREQKREVHEGNCDLKRVKREVLIPFKETGKYATARFNPQRQKLEEYQSYQGDVLILEGNYSLHPDLESLIDTSVFLDIDPDRQQLRLENRSFEKLEQFLSNWIPQSQDYFRFYEIKNKVDAVLIIKDSPE